MKYSGYRERGQNAYWGRCIGPNRRQPSEKPINIRRGESGGEGLYGTLSGGQVCPPPFIHARPYDHPDPSR